MNSPYGMSLAPLESEAVATDSTQYQWSSCYREGGHVQVEQLLPRRGIRTIRALCLHSAVRMLPS